MHTYDYKASPRLNPEDRLDEPYTVYRDGKRIATAPNRDAAEEVIHERKRRDAARGAQGRSVIVGTRGPVECEIKERRTKLYKPDLRAANAVFAELQKLGVTGELPVTRLYSNGREQGYTILSGQRQVSFSENRNSDDIVVYRGSFDAFDGAGVPAPDVYSERRYFSTAKEAARFVAAWLNGRQAR